MGPVTTSPRRSQDLARAVRGSPVRTWRREGKLSRRQKPYTTGQRACRPAGRNSGTRGKIRIQAKTDKSSDISHVVSTKYVGWLPERCDRRHKIWASVSFALHRPRVAPPGVTLGAGRHPSPLSRRRSVLIRMEAGPAVQPGERRGGRGRSVPRPPPAACPPHPVASGLCGPGCRQPRKRGACPVVGSSRADVRKPLTAGLLRMRPTTLMQLARTDPATRLGELWPAA